MSSPPCTSSQQLDRVPLNLLPTDYRKFLVWREELLREITTIGEKLGGTGLLVDCYVPYRMGWGPRRTAIALLSVHQGDKDILSKDELNRVRAERAHDARQRGIQQPQPSNTAGNTEGKATGTETGQ